MGARVSKNDSAVKSVSKVTNTVLNETINKIKNDAEVQAKAYQTIEVNFDGSKVNCGIEVIQDSTVNAQAMVNASAKLSSEMDTEMKAKLKEEIQNTLAKESKGLNLGVGVNIAKVTTDTMSEINNNIKNIIQNSIENSVKVDAENNQKINFIARNARFECPPGGSSIKLSQTGLTDAVATNISTNLVDAIMKTKAISELEKEVKQEVSDKEEGISGGALVGIVIGLVVIAIIVGLIYWSLKSGGARQMMQPMPPMQPPQYYPSPQVQQGIPIAYPAGQAINAISQLGAAAGQMTQAR